MEHKDLDFISEDDMHSESDYQETDFMEDEDDGICYVDTEKDQVSLS